MGRRHREKQKTKNPNSAWQYAIWRDLTRQILGEWRFVPHVGRFGCWDLHQKDKLLEHLVWKTNRADVQGSQSARGNQDPPFGGLMCDRSLQDLETKYCFEKHLDYMQRSFICWSVGISWSAGHCTVEMLPGDGGAGRHHCHALRTAC